VNSEQKRHLQRQPFLGAARRGFSCVAATFASQLLNNPAGISQITLFFWLRGKNQRCLVPKQTWPNCV